MIWMAVLIGGALGSGARHGVNVAAARLLGTAAPYGTAIVNMAGSLVIGLLAGALVAQRISMTDTTRAFVFVGVIGGLTTFSSLMLDSLTLLERGATASAMVNMAGQLVLGFALVYAGYRLGVSSPATSFIR